MTILKSSALSIEVQLVFEMHYLNGVLFLKAIFFCALSFSLAAAAKRSIVPFTIKYVSL